MTFWHAIGALAIVCAFSACTPLQQDNLTREAAGRVIKPVLANQFPGVPLDAATDCVIENASRDELLSMAADAVTGPTASTTQIVTTVLSRPATTQCLATSGLPELLSRL